MSKKVGNIVVAGASGTVGLELTKQAMTQGLKVVALCRTNKGKEKLEHNVMSHEQRSNLVDILLGDYSSSDDVGRVMGLAKEKLGAIDSFVSAVGRFVYSPIASSQESDFDNLLNANLKSPWLFSRYCLEEMEKNQFGRLLFVSSIVTLANAPSGMGMYAASKAGLNALIHSMTDEMKGKDITINAVCPSIIDTKENREAMGADQASQWVKPATLASFLLTLLGENASSMKGALIPFPANS